MATSVPGYRTLQITLTDAHCAELEEYVAMLQEREQARPEVLRIRYTPEGIATGAVLWFLSEMKAQEQEGVK